MLRIVSYRYASKVVYQHNNFLVTKTTQLLQRPNVRNQTNAAIVENFLPSTFATIWQGISNSTPVAYLQEGLVQLHDVTGLPWWCSIMLTTVCLRLIITMPLAIYQQKIACRLELLTLEMKQLTEELKREAAIAKKKFNWTEEQTKRVFIHSWRKQWNKLIVRDNCHPFKMFIVLWGQIPLWICQSMALRNLVYMLPDPMSMQAQISFAELTVGGFGWIPNLTEVDSSYILPVALSIINLAIIEVQCGLRAHLPQKRLQKWATNFFRLVSIAMIPIACTVPSALCIYWTTSSAFGLAQNLLLAAPSIRRAVGIPITVKELQQPYTLLAEHFKRRVGLKNKTITENGDKT